MKARGFSLVEVIVALGVMAIGMMALSGYIAHISDQQRILIQKAEAVAIDTNITNLFSTTTLHCSGNIQAANIIFPSGLPPSTTFPIACPACTITKLNYYKADGTILGQDITTGLQTDGSGINIANVELTNLTFKSAGIYTANIAVTYAGTPPTPPGFQLPGTIMIMAKTVGANDQLETCSNSTCQPGYTLVGKGAPGDQDCISTSAQGPATYSQALNACVTSSPMAHLCTQSEWQEACLWDQPSPFGFDGDGGPKLRLGEQVFGPGGRGNGGGTTEIVGSLVQVYDGGNWKEGPILVGGTVVDTNQKHRCYSFKDWWANQDVGGGGSYAYRCCYRP